MGIRFRCQACDKKLNVKAFLGGKRGICPHCGAKIAIPPAEGAPPVAADMAARQAASAARTGAATMAAAHPTQAVAHSPSSPSPTAPQAATPQVSQPAPQPVAPAPQPAPQPQPAAADPLTAAGASVWYVRPPSGGQYGPASADYMRRWIDEGRISGDSLVWREGWADWQAASTALGGLLGGGPAPGPSAAAPTSAAAPFGSPSFESPASPLGSSIATGDSSITKRSVPRRKKSSSGLAIASVIVLGLVGIGLLVALIMVVSQSTGGS